MDKETDHKLHEFAAKVLKNFYGETPSSEFTKQVMSRVKDLSKSEITRYKPLISNRLWIFIIVLILGLFSYLIFGNIQPEDTLASSKVLELLPNIDFYTLPDYQLSNVFLYGIVGLTFFICVQILLLKNYFNRRLAAS